MEEHFLKGKLEGEPEFKVEPWYNPHGDCIIYQIADEAFAAERIDELLTVYNSVIDNRTIGFQIKGVQAIIQKFGLEGLAVKAETAHTSIKGISIIALLLAAYEEGPRTFGRRKAYASAMDFSSEHRSIPTEELQLVG